MGAVELVSIALPAAFWPLVVLLIAAGQRKPIGRLIDRIRRGSGLGISFEAPSAADLDNAVGGVAASPEVAKVIQAASDAVAAETLTDGGEPSVGKDHLLPNAAIANESFAGRKAFLERLTVAQQRDQERRRSEIEQVVRTAARWGAEMARSTPDNIDNWELDVRWKADGEAEVVPVLRPSARLRADYEWTMAEVENGNAERRYMMAKTDSDRAAKALAEASQPTDELRVRAREAADRVTAERNLWQNATRDVEQKRRLVGR